MLSAVARRELAADGIAVSTVYPAVTATEFHQSLAAGGRVGGGWGGPPPHSPEMVAEAIVSLIESGEEEAQLTQDWSGAPAIIWTGGSLFAVTSWTAWAATWWSSTCAAWTAR
jgi:short-subunit dehydrogenase